MFKRDKPYWTFFCFLAGLSFFPLAMPTSFKIDEQKSRIFQSFPFEIGEWKGKDAPVDDRTYEILETKNVLARIYENRKGEKIYLMMVGSYKDRRVAHPPEVCYLSSNYSILNESDGKIQIQGKEIPVKEFSAKDIKHPDYQEQVLYLYRVGNRYTTNYYEQQLQFARDRLTRKDSQVLLIRLSGLDRTLFGNFLSEVLEQF